jgi:hypothetical protein
LDKDMVVSDGVVTARELNFTTVRHSGITGHVAYLPDPFDAPAWIVRTAERHSASPTVEH